MKRSIQNKFRNGSQRGFTLVEMLVSVALVLLMMTMFTSIFQMATTSVSKQRVIAETDQRARSLTTILRADFAKRSMRYAFPFLPFEDTALTAVPFGNRQGYVYISCNNPASGQDDLIQFTVDARQIQTNPDQSLYYGAAKMLWDRIAENNGVSVNPLLQFSPNQPEADEGDMFPNGASGSNGAEISIFLRGGNLIRRVMLLRDPLPVAAHYLAIQPTSGLGNQFFLTGGGGGSFFLLNPNGTSGTVSDDFWRHFDFSAVPRNLSDAPNGVDLVGIDALSNEGTTALGNPRFRFGFNPVVGPAVGLSREHTSASLDASFLGRYLHSETSSVDFNWPNAPSAIGNPMDVRNSAGLNTGNGIVTAFQGSFQRGGERRVEDVLMSNVREFRVEVWDSRLERWVVPGHQISRVHIAPDNTAHRVLGDYHVARNWQRYASTEPNADSISYGPKQLPGSADIPHVFDSWHRGVIRNINVNAVNESAEIQAPYYALKYYPPDQDGSTNRAGVSQVGPAPFRNPDPRSEYDPVGRKTDVNQGYWRPNTPYEYSDVVFADRNLATPGWDANNDNLFDWSIDEIPRESIHIAFRCLGSVTGGTGGTSGTSMPAWQSPGLQFVDNDLLWESFSNSSPLKSVRLTIRFTEPTSETPKQLTLVMPLTDEER
jgi:prepilin-type N-terminal cleavage/methylation domain-containing protein